MAQSDVPSVVQFGFQRHACVEQTFIGDLRDAGPRGKFVSFGKLHVRQRSLKNIDGRGSDCPLR